jgi:hypothetical protein
MDENIRQAEQIIGGMTISEALYGGPKGPGLNANILKLTDIVTNLSTTVSELSRTITKIVDDVNGGDGLRVSLRDVKRDIQEIRDEANSAKKIIWRCIYVLVLIGIGTIIMDTRVAYNIFIGGAPK